MFHHNLASDFVARPSAHNAPPDVPRRPTKPPLPKVCWPDVALAFMAGLICFGLGVVAAVWVSGG
jgi:hypothetical protein